MNNRYASDRKSSFDWEEWGGAIGFVGFIGIVLVIAFWNNIASVVAGNGWDTNIASSCKDVTSYDHNWNNDMLCTRPDGGTFYTSYEGAKAAQAKYAPSPTASPVSTEVLPSASPSETTTIPVAEKPGTTCKDVTSYDYNWDNDMLCTRSDGSTFYTSYSGARAAEGN